jgi:hypothetical protein
MSPTEVLNSPMRSALLIEINSSGCRQMARYSTHIRVSPSTRKGFPERVEPGKQFNPDTPDMRRAVEAGMAEGVKATRRALPIRNRPPPCLWNCHRCPPSRPSPNKCLDRRPAEQSTVSNWTYAYPKHSTPRTGIQANVVRIVPSHGNRRLRSGLPTRC